ncbi:MAG: response regulator transcription factor [Anaerolineales bacterium]|nr:response regulator transcription factor [Anaerolineales bacterium]
MSASVVPIRVILIDDHRHVHQATAAILSTVTDIELVAQGSNGLEAIRLCQEYRPDLVLMDVVMPEMDGVAATKAICAQFPGVRVLVLSSFRDHESVHEMLRSGAAGYVTKGSLSRELISTIRATHDGKVVFSPEVAAQLLNPAGQAPVRDFGLTERELEILLLMAEGMNNKQIAHSLTISNSTVKFHISNIVHKMGVETRSEALILAAKNHLV